MIPIEDYKVFVQEKRLQLILEEQVDILEEAELIARSTIRDYLYPYYDCNKIFHQVDHHAKHRSVKRWLMVITLYYIYERIPDALVPGRIVKNYDDVITILTNISDGKGVVDLPRLTQDKDGQELPKTKFRWGSEQKRVQS